MMQVSTAPQKLVRHIGVHNWSVTLLERVWYKLVQFPWQDTYFLICSHGFA